MLDFYILIGLAYCILSGSFSAYLAGKKNYILGDWFWLGFFFGIFALITIAGLQYNKKMPVNVEWELTIKTIGQNIKINVWNHAGYVIRTALYENPMLETNSIREYVNVNIPMNVCNATAESLLLSLNKLCTK